MARKSEKPFDKIMLVRSKLDLFAEHGDQALQGQTPAEFLLDVRESFNHLLTFRNIVNGMVRFDEAPRNAVQAYLD